MFAVDVNTVFSQEELRAMARLNPEAGFGLTLSLKEFLDGQGARAIGLIMQTIESNGNGSWPALSPKYQARKAAGKTPGGGKFGVPAMLRDSGNSVAGIQAVTKVTGEVSLAISFPELLTWHASGGKLPVRDPWPAEQRDRFAAELAVELDRFMSGANITRAFPARNVPFATASVGPRGGVYNTSPGGGKTYVPGGQRGIVPG